MQSTTNRYVARQPATIGDMEQLAGVEDRDEFWKPLIPVFKQDTEKGMKTWRRKVSNAISRRVKAGQLSLLYRH